MFVGEIALADALGLRAWNDLAADPVGVEHEAWVQTARPARGRLTDLRLTAKAVGCLAACAAIAHNLTRAAGTLAGGHHARARTATIRTQLIHTPARLAHSAHQQVLHLPCDRPGEPGLNELIRRALHDTLLAAA